VKVPLNEYDFSSKKVANVQSQLERLIEKNFYLHKSAREGYRSYLQAYSSHSHKHCFNIETLDLQKVAKAFGFTVPPSVNLTVHSSKGSRVQSRSGSGGFSFRKRKLEGKTQIYKHKKQKLSNSGDSRQFMR
jgi:ATP-dependent RNA helicase DDX18/HAS1